MPAVLLTGASGVLGVALLRRLRDGGARVRCLVRSRVPEGADDVAWGDLADEAALARAVEGVDAVVHLAAVTHARRASQYRRVNAEGTARLVRAGERGGVQRFVLASTRAISREGGAYSNSKLAAENTVTRSGLPFAILRLAEVYGGGGTEGIDTIVDAAARGASIPVVGSGDHEVCPVFIDDAVEALAAAVSAPAAVGRTYTVAGPCTTVREFAAACVRHFGTTARIRRVPTAAVAALGQAARVVPLPLYPDQLARLRAPKPGPSVELRDDLGVAPRSVEEGLRAISAARSSARSG